MSDQKISKEEYLSIYEMDMGNLQKSYETIFERRRENLLNNQTELAEIATQDLQEVSSQMTEMMEAKNKFLREYQEQASSQAKTLNPEATQQQDQEQDKDYDYSYGM
jgi:hypothetical protein